MSQIEVTTTLKIDLSIEMAAKWFAALNDDEQSKFFVAVAKEAEEYDGSAEMQWYAIGSHLKHCECSTEGARDMIRGVMHGLENGTHK
jgi:hypothetical protein